MVDLVPTAASSTRIVAIFSAVWLPLVLAAAGGCAVDRTPRGFGGEVVGATAELAVVDAESDQGLLECWPSVSPISGTGKVVKYRLFYRLNRATQHADLLRIENGWSDEAIPNSINIGSMPATMRIRQTPYAPYTMPRIPPAEVARHRPFYSLVLDAQKIDGTWVVLMEHEPDYGDWTLMGLSGPIATAKEGDFQMGTMQQPRFYAWDIANQSILFVRGAPGSDEVDVWSYSMPSPNVTRFELNSGSYFEWQGDSYKPRAEFSKLVHWDFLKFLKGN